MSELFAALQEDIIRTLYRVFLLREPDPEGLAQHLRDIQRGTSVEDLFRSCLSCQEFSENFETFVKTYLRLERPEGKTASAESASLLSARDTTRDWQIIGASEPYFGVLTNPRFYRRNLDEASLQEFWLSGQGDVQNCTETIKRVLLADFAPRRALDFGCGVGRLTRAMARVARHVVGFDVSPGMLAEARRHEHPNVEFAEVLPDGVFDWINSLIVFQHIPTARGYELFDELLDRLAPGGVISVHVTIFRDQRALPALLDLLLDGVWDGSNLRVLDDKPPPAGHMMIFDYDLNRLLSAAIRRGIGSFYLEHSDHGGCHGVILYGRRRL